MHIIKRGTPPQEREYEATCRNCRTEVRFQQSEGTVTYDQRDGDFVTVKCPVCGQPIHTALR